MSAAPTFTSLPLLKPADLTTGDATRSSSNAQIVDAILTTDIPAAGARLEKIIIQSEGRPADSTILVFIHNGTAYRLILEIDIGAPAAASSTSPAFHYEVPFSIDLPTGYKLGFAVTVTPTTGGIQVWAAGGVLT